MQEVGKFLEGGEGLPFAAVALRAGLGIQPAINDPLADLGGADWSILLLVCSNDFKHSGF
jgi:hypothetical protein